MHSTTLGVAAYALLSSSFTSIFFLLKDSIKKCVKSPLHIFSISDALSSILAGIIFLVNQLNMSSSYHQENNLNNITKFKRNIDLVENNEETDFNKPANCELKYVFMQYGMFFIPFTNAFISLLGYSVHYVANIISVDCSCVDLTKPLKQIMDKESNCINIESTEALSSQGPSIRNNESNLENIISPHKIKTIASNILKKNTFNQPSKYDKITIISVIMEWLVPILLTAILHLGGYEKLSEEQNLKNEECIFATNFPFNNCYLVSNKNKSVLFSLTSYPTSTSNYIEAEDSNKFENPHASEVENVISNVYKLVHTVLNINDSGNINQFNHSNLWSLTAFTEENSPISENENKEWNFFEAIPKDKNETNLKPEMNLESLKPKETAENLEDKINYTDFDLNTSQTLYQKKNSTNYDLNIIRTGTEKIISQTEIFKELINRIQNGIQKVKEKEKARMNREIQPNQANQFSNAILRNEKHCMDNQCFIPSRFLKVHLFLLFFTVYFIPILASTVLSVYATYKYKQIKEKVQTNRVTLKFLTNFDKEIVKRDKKDQDYEDVTGVKKVGWMTENGKKFQENEIIKEKTSAMEIEIFNEEEMFVNILEELGKTQKFSKVLKINLLLAILLWTPLFMEVLSKVFLCMNVPNWLMDSSFLGAVSFGIMRNFLNINMIKTLRISSRIKNSNCVHPSS